jgi:cell wall-associated NlpC family hydrolase
MRADKVNGVDIAGERAAVVAEARSWLLTPFHHHAAIKGVGVDCAQLLIAVYAATGVVDRPDVAEYSPDWFLHEDGEALERFSDWIRRLCVAVIEPRPGDIALFRYGRAVSHGAIVVDRSTVIHSFRELGVILGSLEPTHDLFPRLAGFWSPRRWRVE